MNIFGLPPFLLKNEPTEAGLRSSYCRALVHSGTRLHPAMDEVASSYRHARDPEKRVI